MFKSAAGVNIQHVPYRGSAPAVTDLVGGQIEIMFDPLQSVLSNVQGGRLRAIALSEQRAVARAAERADDRRIRLPGLRDDRVVGRVRARRAAERSGGGAGR